MFNVGLIDSLKVRVKMTQLQILDKRIIEDYICYYPTLDSLDSDNQYFDEELHRAKPYTQIVHGITYRFYPKAFITTQQVAEEYMVFQLSAKMAKSQYFNGITLHNIDKIVNDINAFGVIKITKKAMLQGLVSDIDICINHIIKEKPLLSAFTLINRFLRPSKRPLIHNINKINTKGQRNLGIDFNKREKATNSTPYCKIYHKGHELQSKSIDFYKKYLEPMESSVLNNLVRYEFTIKAHKHKKYLIEKGFNADFKTLEDLLSAKQDDLTKIAKSGLNHYSEPRVRSPVDEKQKPIDIVLQHYIENLIRLGADTDTLMGFSYHLECKQARSRMKTKIKKMVADIESRSYTFKDKLITNDLTNEFLNNIGFDLKN